jgi:hypothetical protein
MYFQPDVVLLTRNEGVQVGPPQFRFWQNNRMMTARFRGELSKRTALRSIGDLFPNSIGRS